MGLPGGGVGADQPAQRQPLHDAKAVLLVDHAQTHARHAHVLLNQGVGADDELNLAAGNALEQNFSFPRRRRCRQERGGDAESLGKFLQGAIVLLGEHFGGRHPERLIALLDDLQRC